MPENDNPVLAILKEMQTENRLDRQGLRVGLNEIKIEFKAINSRVRDNEVDLVRVEGLGYRMQEVEVELARVKERQNIMTVIASAIGIAASAVAAWLGMKQ